MTILVIGGTGRVGSATIAALQASSETVRCLSHSPEKLAKLHPQVEGVYGDLDDPATLDDAFSGVRAVLLSLPVTPDELRRGMTAIDAAESAGVEKIVHISVKHYPGSETRVFYQAKKAIEDRLATAPLTWTVIHAANFFQADSTLKSYVLDQGLYTPPIGSIGVDKMDARDVGFAAAKSLTSDTYDNRSVDLYGPRTYTGQTAAAVFAKAMGRPVAYMGDDIERWAQMNAPRLGPWYIQALSGLYEQQQTHGMLRPQGEPQHPLLPATLRTFEDYASELAAAWLS